MIIETQSDMTAAVLSELDRASNPGFREIMKVAVSHVHAFMREAKLRQRTASG